MLLEEDGDTGVSMDIDFTALNELAEAGKV
jgi:hypothetical protein